MADINPHALDRELKRGSAELLILSLFDARPRHRCELSKLIHARSGGQQRKTWATFVEAVWRVTADAHA